MNRDKKTNWIILRGIFNEIHLWLGLICGLIIIPVCFTGTIYTYNAEIREAFNAHLHKVTPDGPKKSPEELMEIVGKESSGRVTAVQWPTDRRKSIAITVKEENDNSRFGTSYYLNPYSGEVMGSSLEKTGIDELMGLMFSLHRWLLLDRIEEPIFEDLPNRTLGSYITGAATILFTLGLFTGMVIWFPQKFKAWKQGLKVKWRANWKRVNFDLHNTLAFYSLIFLLCMGLTGPFWSFPWYKTGWQKFWGTFEETSGQRGPGPRGGGGPGQNAHGSEKEAEILTLLPVSEYLKKVDEVLTYQGDYRINLPASAGQPLSVQKNRVGFFAPSAGDKVELDAFTGQIISTDIFREKPLNVRMSRSIKALHIGDVYGPFTKLLYFIACLIATSLPITGTLIWINKLKKKRNIKKRVAA